MHRGVAPVHGVALGQKAPQSRKEHAMTRFNWEKARSRERYLKSVFRNHGSPDGEGLFVRTFDINDPSHNPLGLSDDDCRGQMPSSAKRTAIFKFLLQKDRSLRDRYSASLTSPDANIEISPKDFAEFSRRVFMTSLDWPDDRCPLESVMPVAVCFSIFYLSLYNDRASKHERAKILTLEIYQSLLETPLENRSPS